MQRVLILVDTNALIAANFKIISPVLKEFLRNKFHRMVVSQVCIDEAFRKLYRHTDKIKSDFINLIKDARRYGFDVSEEFLGDSKLVDSFNNEVLDFINVIRIDLADLKFIYEKSLNLEKPFKKKNEKESGGFRDNVIWSSYLRYLELENEKFDKIIFVCNDTDFIVRVENKLTLVDDLIRDLRAYEIDLEKVSVVSSFRDLNETVLQPKLPIIQEFNYQFGENIKMLLSEEVSKSNEAIESAIETHVHQLINGAETEPNFHYIEPRGKILFPQKMNEFPDGDIYIYFTQEFSVGFEYFLHKSEVFELSETRNLSISDPEWNEHVMLVEEEWFVNVGFDVILDITDPNNIKVSEFYIHDELKIEY